MYIAYARLTFEGHIALEDIESQLASHVNRADFKITEVKWEHKHMPLTTVFLEEAD